MRGGLPCNNLEVYWARSARAYRRWVARGPNGTSINSQQRWHSSRIDPQNSGYTSGLRHQPQLIEAIRAVARARSSRNAVVSVINHSFELAQ